MQVPVISLVEDVLPALTVVSVVADVLTSPLPQPDYVSMSPGSSPSVGFQFNEPGSGAARFDHVRAWADSYDAEVVRSGRFLQTVFSFLGAVEFTVYAQFGDEDE
ncbi:MAG TPA: hypothetical protein VGG83_03235 [Trebonia sp.]|jgi:hypothetical protein